MAKATDQDPIPSRGFNPGGCLLLIFVVLLLAALPPLLKTLGIVLAVFGLIIVVAVVHGAVEGKGGWGALFRDVREAIARPFRRSR